jgi:glycosyltransferase involved in cell wall biosynthesis
MQLSVVIPVYNEAATIREVIRRVKQTPYQKQIIIVDDGSTDGTREILCALNDPEIEIVFHEKNQGKAGALRTGFARARGDFVIIQDADLEYDPADYPKLLAPLIRGEADVVYGSRFTGPERRVLLFWHTVANRFLTLLSNITTNLNLTDMETGYKVFRLEVVRRIRIESSRFGVEPELTAKVARLGYRVYEVPIRYHGRSYAEGKKITWKDGVQAIWAIIKYGVLPSPAGDHYGNDALAVMDSLDRYNDYLWQQIQRYVGRRVFEAGCGTGTITKFLVGRDLLVSADYDRAYLSLLRKYADRPNVRLVQVDFSVPDWPFATSAAFDTVICMNVLEHLPNDMEVIRQFYRLLQPGGRLILLVPANPWLYGSLDRALGHHRRYQLGPLVALVTAAGFRVLESRYLNLVGVVGWFLNSRLLRRRALPRGQAALLNAAWPLLRPLERLRLPAGLSCLVVAEKPREGASA